MMQLVSTNHFPLLQKSTCQMPLVLCQTSCGADGATEQERGSSPVLQVQEWAPLREKVRKETAAQVSHQARLHGYSPWRVGGGCSCQTWSWLLPLQVRRRFRTPSSTHKSIPGCLIRIRWGKGLGFVPWSSQAMAHSRKPSQHACAEDELDTSEFVVEH